MIITKAQVKEIIGQGGFVSVWFIKKDGSLRYLHGREGVHKYTVGGKRTTDPNEYIILHECSQGAEDAREGNERYRNVSIERLIAVAAKGEVFIVE